MFRWPLLERRPATPQAARSGRSGGSGHRGLLGGSYPSGWPLACCRLRSLHSELPVKRLNRTRAEQSPHAKLHCLAKTRVRLAQAETTTEASKSTGCGSQNSEEDHRPRFGGVWWPSQSSTRAVMMPQKGTGSRQVHGFVSCRFSSVGPSLRQGADSDASTLGRSFQLLESRS